MGARGLPRARSASTPSTSGRMQPFARQTVASRIRNVNSELAAGEPATALPRKTSLPRMCDAGATTAHPVHGTNARCPPVHPITAVNEGAMTNPVSSPELPEPESEPLTLDEADYDKCMLYDAPSIRAQLQQLIDKRCTLSATSDAGGVNMTTVPLAIEGDTLWLDAPPTGYTLHRVLQCERLSLVGAIDKVTLRFSSGPPLLSVHGGHPALALPLPDRLLHLQRREIMRREPPAGALHCLVPGRGRAQGAPPITTSIRDIGGGGLAVLVADDALVLATGDLLPGCVIDLPGLGPVEVTLRVCHVRHVHQRGKDVLQAGCQFIDLPAATQAKLFRYLMQLDREQLARRRERD